MIRVARYAYLVAAWAFLAGVVVQVFFIGLGLFAGSQNLELHVTLGWILHLIPILMLGLAALARAGRTRILQAAALAVTVFVVPILVILRDDLPGRGGPAPGRGAAGVLAIDHRGPRGDEPDEGRRRRRRGGDPADGSMRRQ